MDEPRLSDDDIDGLGLFGRMLDKLRPGRLPKGEQPHDDDWRYGGRRRRGEAEGGDSWRTA